MLFVGYVFFFFFFLFVFFFFQAEDGIRYRDVTGVQTCALPIYFDKVKIFWMGCRSTPDELNILHHHLGDALAACDYQADNRPYAPHLTLMRKLIKPGKLESFNSISWNINNFVLVESVSVECGVRYEVIKKY